MMFNEIDFHPTGIPKKIPTSTSHLREDAGFVKIKDIPITRNEGTSLKKLTFKLRIIS